MYVARQQPRKTSNARADHKLCYKCAMDRRLPSLESLRVFEACARHSNFSRAAAELGVTPTAVSLRMRELARELDTALFVRTGPKIRLTGAGEALSARMTAIMAELRDAVDRCRARRGPIRIAAAPTFAARWLVSRLPRWNAVEGAAPVRIISSTGLDDPEDFDVAIRSGVGPWPELEIVASLPIERTPMMAPGLAVAEPAGLLDLLLSHDDRWRDWFAGAGIAAPRVRTSPVDYPTQELAAAAAVAGGVVALLSPSLFAGLIAEGKLVQPFAHVMRGPDSYHLLRRTSESRPAVKRFCDWLAGEF